MIIFRDDDISVNTNFLLFKQVHEVFKKHKVNHRLAILAKDLWENKELFWYICNEPFIDAQLHGWTHKDYANGAKLKSSHTYQELKKALNYLSENSERMTQGRRTIRPNTFLPPWNKTNPNLVQVCKELDMTVDVRRGEKEGVILFHYWQDYNTIESLILKYK